MNHKFELLPFTLFSSSVLLSVKHFIKQHFLGFPSASSLTLETSRGPFQSWKEFCIIVWKFPGYGWDSHSLRSQSTILS